MGTGLELWQKLPKQRELAAFAGTNLPQDLPRLVAAARIQAALSSELGIPIITALLQLQGYIEPAGRDEWLTTLSGETVSGSKTPRLTLDNS